MRHPEGDDMILGPQEAREIYGALAGPTQSIVFAGTLRPQAVKLENRLKKYIHSTDAIGTEHIPPCHIEIDQIPLAITALRHRRAGLLSPFGQPVRPGNVRALLDVEGTIQRLFDITSDAKGFIADADPIAVVPDEEE